MVVMIVEDEDWLKHIEQRHKSALRTHGLLWGDDWSLAVYGCTYLLLKEGGPNGMSRPVATYLNWWVVPCM